MHLGFYRQNRVVIKILCRRFPNRKCLHCSFLFQVNPWSDNTNWGRARILTRDAFLPSQEDNVIVVNIVWGLEEQDRGDCHHTDFECKGKTVFDKSFDLNPPPCQTAILVSQGRFHRLPFIDGGNENFQYNVT